MFIYVKKIVNYIRIHGFKRFIIRSTRFFKERHMMKKYHTKLIPTEQELRAQRNAKFPYMPLISIVVPMYNTKEKYLRELLDSVANQTYVNWQLCLADGSDEGAVCRDIVKEYQKRFFRIAYKAIKNKNISDNTNEAIAMAEGDFIVFADHDDRLAEFALYEIVKCINETKNVDFIYSDEDKMSADGKKFYSPHFKSDFNIDLLRSVNYICHMVAVSRTLLNKTGLLDNKFDGAQDYDFVLRSVEQAECIKHIPKLLYHWREHVSSTAFNPDSKKYAYDAGRRALEAHYKRMKIDAGVDRMNYPGYYRTRYELKDNPLVSVIIPNKDHIDDLKRCVESLYEINEYKNIETIIVENNSENKETFEYYEQLKERYGTIRVVIWEKDFNYSAINNFGAGFAKGKYILLLNNDVRFIPDCSDGLKEMVAVCERDDVGIVGSKLYYEDGAIQHAGVILGIRGVAGHAFAGKPHEDMGYFNRAVIMQDLSAVTAACMLVKKEVYTEAGGLDETLKVAFNDVDFCLKVRENGWLVVFDPYAELIHGESKSRGAEDSVEKIRRFNREIDRFKEKWQQELAKGDPYYNVNLTLEMCDFSMKVE